MPITIAAKHLSWPTTDYGLDENALDEWVATELHCIVRGTPHGQPGPAFGILGFMSFFDRKEPWYIGGLAFECQNCGRCCAGPEEGYVWLNEREIAAIAGFLGMPEAEMREKYVRRVGRRFSLREHRPSRDCVFLEPDGQGRRTCSVYPVRPAQCRTWPYWPGNLRRPEDWSAAAVRCRGVNRGKIVSFNEIETRRIETSDD